jgi:hypothetical protein
MTFTEPLDFQRILINNLAGSSEIFMLISFIAVGIVTAALKIPRLATMVLLGLFAVMFADYFPAIYLLTVVIAGMVAANATAKIITR